MKFIRWAAAVVLALMSLLNIGTVAGNDAPAWTTVAGVILGVAGLIAVYGLFRDRAWAPPLAASAGAVNLVLGVLSLAVGWSGGAIGLVLSAVGLALLAPVLLRRRTAVAAH